nr:immunoglobulin heavy chain junction region [Macaca mulatta]MOY18696.1 immunoglobulin heavy chain junction region [Macaca mulatta]MOY19241.1 immunoglobulin heavy chain junction region [Macaca mulatta]MOY19561.1 immunoglobulin heavy chain junction region [Macaca mulatta]MOY19945.1 immunoglobulin heavy chain junction region [Macaca mulatta]
CATGGAEHCTAGGCYGKDYGLDSW